MDLLKFLTVSVDLLPTNNRIRKFWIRRIPKGHANLDVGLLNIIYYYYS